MSFLLKYLASTPLLFSALLCYSFADGWSPLLGSLFNACGWSPNNQENAMFQASFFAGNVRRVRRVHSKQSGYTFVEWEERKQSSTNHV